MGILWIIIIGFVAGLIARWLAPGPNNPVGFLLTTALGIAGAFVATYIGQAVGWYRLDQGAGLIAATLGAVVVLFVWHRLVVNRTIRDPGNPGAIAEPASAAGSDWILCPKTHRRPAPRLPCRILVGRHMASPCHLHPEPLPELKVEPVSDEERAVLEPALLGAKQALSLQGV